MHLHLIVLEVGLLQDNGGTVGQCQLLIAEGLVLSLLRNLTLLNLGSVQQRLVLHIVDVSLQFLGTCCSDGSGHVFLGRVYLALLVLCHDHDNQVAVRRADELRQHLVDGLYGDVGCNLLHGLIEDVQWWDRLVGQIVVAIGIAELVVLALVAVGVALLQAAQVVGLGTLVLCCGESELTCTLGLAVEHLQCLHLLALLGDTDQLEAVLGA